MRRVDAKPLHAATEEPGRPSRDLGSREAILRAASAELAEVGFQGARIERIARRAGYNKSLVYRHFKDREGLIRAVLRHQLERRWQVFASLPEDVGDAIVHWYRQTREAQPFLRLLMREALNDEGKTVEEEDRSEYYQTQIDLIRRSQDAGAIDRSLDPVMLFLALQALISYPSFFPQLTRLITGRSPDDQTFQESWEELLAGLARLLQPAAEKRRAD